MIQILIKSKSSWTIWLRHLLDIGDVTITKNGDVKCRNASGGGNLIIQGKLLDSKEIVELINVELIGNDREYEEWFKSLCACSQGEVKASVILNGGEKIFKFHSINGAMIEEEVVI